LPTSPGSQCPFFRSSHGCTIVAHFSTLIVSFLSFGPRVAPTGDDPNHIVPPPPLSLPPHRFQSEFPAQSVCLAGMAAAPPPPIGCNIEGIPAPISRHQARHVGSRWESGMVGDGLWFPFFFGEGGWVLVPVLLWRGRRPPHWCLTQGGGTSTIAVADLQPRQSGVGHFSYRSSAPLISEASYGMWRRLWLDDVQHVACSGGASSMWQAGLPPRAD
jgi:hypothetical protein